MAMIVRRYDIPISYRWYEIVIEVEKESGRRKIFLDSALKVEDQVWQLVAHILDIEGTKILIKDFNDTFGYTVMVGEKTLDQHIHDHSKEYSTWEVTLPGGAKTKVIANKDPNAKTVFFRGKRVPGIEKIRWLAAFWKFEWKYNEVEFKIEFVIERTWTETLVMNKKIVDHFQPRQG
uniref:SRPBCC family protein n=1 Tax=Caenorhabditis tropicalis TaxID=1561998 RepID=A0A1I7UAB9_9PELO